MTTPDVVTVRQASGWWPSLVTLSCSRCGQDWTLNLNDAPWTASSYVARKSAEHLEQCDG